MKRLSPEEARAERQKRRSASAPVKRRPSEQARKAAAEAQYRRYLKLVCGHYGAREDTDVLFRSLRPDKDAWWCDVEGKWTVLQPRNTEKPVLPEKAPF